MTAEFTFHISELLEVLTLIESKDSLPELVSFSKDEGKTSAAADMIIPLNQCTITIRYIDFHPERLPEHILNYSVAYSDDFEAETVSLRYAPTKEMETLKRRIARIRAKFREQSRIQRALTEFNRNNDLHIASKELLAAELLTLRGAKS